MNTIIQLQQRWSLGAEVGRGGFGRVYEATNDEGGQFVAKLVPVEPGADRELLFEDLGGVRQVVPIIDSGEWDNHWVLIMPRAEKSLRDHLVLHGSLQPQEVVAILSDITMALADLNGRIIHRDIKPENVLFLNGHWCLSDFGIGRYAEATTASSTHKWEWTRPYNPPERWRGERATPASDIYSLGIMVYELLTGTWPFPGPDFRSQHLNDQPPSLPNCPAPLASLVASCLMKAKEVRPSAADIFRRLQTIFSPTIPAFSQLQAADFANTEEISKATAMQSAARSAAERQREIATSARQTLELIAQRLFKMILENAPSAVWSAGRQGGYLGSSVSLSSAKLTITSVEEARPEAHGPRKPAIEVVAFAAINLRFPPDRFRYEGRSHSLWFCDAQEEGRFSWFETAFMYNPFMPQRGTQDPFSMPPDQEAYVAISPVISQFQVAWPFTPIIPGEEDEFIERWIDWFASAAQGRLTHPSSMPERRPDGSWRR